MPWPPTHKIYDYKGPYPVKKLEDARKVLIESLTDPNLGYEYERLKPLIGLDSRFGRARKPPPVVVNELRGHNIDKASLPESAFTCSYDSPYMLSGRLPKTDPKLKRFLHLFPNTHSDEAEASDGDGTVASTSGVNRMRTSAKTAPSATISSPQQLLKHIEQGEVSSGRDSPSVATKRKLKESKDTGSEKKKSKDVSTVASKRKVDEFVEIGPEKKKSRTDKDKEASLSGSSSIMNKSQDNNSAVSNKSASSTNHVEDAKPISVHQSDEPLKDMKQTFLTYKCDYCPQTCTSSEELAEHLDDQSHRYGSLYRARKHNNRIELIYVEKMFAVKNSMRIKSPYYVLCTECDFASECAHTVALHHKYVHQAEIGSCSIVTIIEDKTVRWDHLYDFYHESLRSKNVNFLVVVCPLCKYSTTGVIHDMKTHLDVKHKTSQSQVTVLSVKVCSLGGRIQIMPRLANPNESGVRDTKPELEVLEKLQMWHAKTKGIGERLSFLLKS